MAFQEKFLSQGMLFFDINQINTIIPVLIQKGQ